MVPDTTTRRDGTMQPHVPTRFVQSVFESASHGSGVLLVFDVLLNDFQRCAAHSRNEVAIRPEGREATLQLRVLFTEEATATAFDLLNQSMDTKLRVALDEQVDVVGHRFEFDNFTVTFFADFLDNLFKTSLDVACEYMASILRAPNDVVLA